MSMMTGTYSLLMRRALPLLEGKNIHQFVHDFAEPTYRLKEGTGERALVERAGSGQRKGDRLVPARRRRTIADGSRATIRSAGVASRSVPALLPGDRPRN